MNETFNEFLLGGVAMGFLIAGTHFLRFWRETRDSLHLLFAISFWVEAANRTALAIGGGPNEGRPAYFVLRLISYVLIVAGIISKNLPRRSKR